jgi:hypothetical protein
MTSELEWALPEMWVWLMEVAIKYSFLLCRFNKACSAALLYPKFHVESLVLTSPARPTLLLVYLASWCLSQQFCVETCIWKWMWQRPWWNEVEYIMPDDGQYRPKHVACVVVVDSIHTSIVNEFRHWENRKLFNYVSQCSRVESYNAIGVLCMLNSVWEHHGREHFLAACKSGVLRVRGRVHVRVRACLCARAHASSCRNLRTVTRHCSHWCLENAVGNLWTQFVFCMMLPAARPADFVYNRMECSVWIVMTCYCISCFPFPWGPGRKNCLRIQHCAPRSCTGHRLGQV